jgi:hypothetical protein
MEEGLPHAGNTRDGSGKAPQHTGSGGGAATSEEVGDAPGEPPSIPSASSSSHLTSTSVGESRFVKQNDQDIKDVKVDLEGDVHEIAHTLTIHAIADRLTTNAS